MVGHECVYIMIIMSILLSPICILKANRAERPCSIGHAFDHTQSCYAPLQLLRMLEFITFRVERTVLEVFHRFRVKQPNYIYMDSGCSILTSDQ